MTSDEKKLKLGFFGPMKTLDSASTEWENFPDGRVRVRIEHETMKGVTPEMMVWWFSNIDSFIPFNGTDFTGPEVPVYRFWHPWDHMWINWVKKVKGVNGELLPGSAIRVRENIGGVHELHETAHVTRFDDRAFNFAFRPGGLKALEVGHLDHLYAPVEGGSSYVTEMWVGVKLPLLGKLINKFIRTFIFPDRVLRDWLLHNVEEAGETEKFVPQLYHHGVTDAP